MVTVDGSTAAAHCWCRRRCRTPPVHPSFARPSHARRRVRGGGAANLSDTGVILVNSFSSRVVTNSVHGGRAKLLARLSRGPRRFFFFEFIYYYFSSIICVMIPRVRPIRTHLQRNAIVSTTRVFKTRAPCICYAPAVRMYMYACICVHGVSEKILSFVKTCFPPPSPSLIYHSIGYNVSVANIYSYSRSTASRRRQFT